MHVRGGLTSFESKGIRLYKVRRILKDLPLMEYSEDPEYEPILASVDVSTQKSYCSFLELLQELSPIMCFFYLIMTCNSYIIIVKNYCFV